MLRIKLLSTYCEIALRWIRQNIFDDKSTLVQVMAYLHWATSHYLTRFWLWSMSPWLQHNKFNGPRCSRDFLKTFNRQNLIFWCGDFQYLNIQHPYGTLPVVHVLSHLIISWVLTVQRYDGCSTICGLGRIHTILMNTSWIDMWQMNSEVNIVTLWYQEIATRSPLMDFCEGIYSQLMVSVTDGQWTEFQVSP